MTNRHTVMPPLTEEWFRTAMNPRHAVDGTVTYVLTPPKREGSIGWAFVGLAFVVAVGVVFTYPLWR